jgi:hypothetical protein
LSQDRVSSQATY